MDGDGQIPADRGNSKCQQNMPSQLTALITPMGLKKLPPKVD